jgi:hypothetical protein
MLWKILPIALCLAVSAATDPVVDLGYASYQGLFNTTTGLSTFFGIRYAASPAGTRSF